MRSAEPSELDSTIFVLCALGQDTLVCRLCDSPIKIEMIMPMLYNTQNCED